MKLFRTAVLFLLVGLWGCIGEGKDNCPPDNNLLLKFSYIADNGDDILTDRVKKISLFFFDEDGYFVQRQNIEQSSLDADQSLPLNLVPGTYRIVSWGNMFENTGACSLDGNTHFDNAYIYNNTLQDGSATSCDPLCYADARSASRSDGYSFTVPHTGMITQTLDFICAHAKLNIFIEGFTDPDGAGGNLLPLVQVETVETNWDFSMQPFGTICNYTQQSVHQTIEGNDLATVYINLPLFKDDNPLKLHIKKASDDSTVTSIVLKDYMADNGLSVENTREAVVSILLSYGDNQDVDVTITVPEWGESSVNPEL